MKIYNIKLNQILKEKFPSEFDSDGMIKISLNELTETHIDIIMEIQGVFQLSFNLIFSITIFF